MNNVFRLGLVLAGVNFGLLITAVFSSSAQLLPAGVVVSELFFTIGCLCLGALTWRYR